MVFAGLAAVSLAANAQDFDLFLDERTRPADFREKLDEIHDFSTKTIINLGLPTFRLMETLDDLIGL